MSVHFKFQHLKVFGSTENLYQNFKKYRIVYDEAECTYIYAELAFYNKKFDEEDWTANVRLICTNEATHEAICTLDKTYNVTNDTNIYYSREGWGTPSPGWWKKGKYRWDAYINGEFVGKTHFHIDNKGLVTTSANPYLTLKGVRLFESATGALELSKRQYLQEFDKSATRYIHMELDIELKTTERPFPVEFQFNFYNDAGQYKASTSYFQEQTETVNNLLIDTAYGAATVGFWYADKYTMEILFMDSLVGIVQFVVSDHAVPHDGSLPFALDSQPTQTSAPTPPPAKPADNPKPTFEEATAELKKLIGLESVKTQMDEFATYLQFLQIRKKKGFEESGKFNMHTVFTGNPGTGKTTVAKMLGQIYYSLDLLSKGHVVEAGRADLVGEYIGQTAPKVQKLLEKARGGILFIDEAYALSDRGDDGKDFGKEVIEVLLKEMSDGAGDLAIVFAGYPQEMQAFLTSNPGLGSRIANSIAFPDYTPNELMEIATYAAQKRDIVLSPEASSFLHRKIVEVYRNRDKHFGNARFVHGIIEECKENMALRLMKSGNLDALDKDALSTVTLDDAERAFGVSNRQLVQIPIDEPLLQEALLELHSLVGMNDIKRDVDELAKLVRYYTEIGRDVKKAFSLHTVFMGNPGTGKTTVARIITKIYKALGVLERGHLVETDREGLVAPYVGQTAIKTDEKIQLALGGCLFIDEAYALGKGGGQNDFGGEAVDTLLKRMEDKRGEFMVIVAGYPDEMRNFLELNPGLMSRFDRTLTFSDYSNVELFDIAIDMLEAEQLYPNDEATTLIRDYIQHLLENKHTYFGNARTVRKVVKEITRRQNLRLALLPASERTPAMIRTVLPEDVQNIQLMEQNQTPKRKSIGFDR